MGLFADFKDPPPVSKPPIICSAYRVTYPVPKDTLKGYTVRFALPLHMGSIAGIAWPFLPPECVEHVSVRVNGVNVAEFREGYDRQGRRLTAGQVLATMNGRGGYWQHSADLVMPFGGFDRVWGLDLSGAKAAEVSLLLDGVSFTSGGLDMAVLFGYSAEPRRQF
jgi:hypothetical protein